MKGNISLPPPPFAVQTRIKTLVKTPSPQNQSGIPKGKALWQGEERKVGFREGRTVKLGFAHLIQSSVRLQFCISKTAVNKILWTKRNA